MRVVACEPLAPTALGSQWALSARPRPPRTPPCLGAEAGTTDKERASSATAEAWAFLPL